MTNPNDLISRKEIEKMMQEVHDSFENEPIDIKIFARAWLKIARDKLSQIESVNGWIPVVPSDIWSNEYAYVMVTDWVKTWPAYYDTHQWFFWYDNELPVDPTLVKLDSFKHNLPTHNQV